MIVDRKTERTTTTKNHAEYRWHFFCSFSGLKAFNNDNNSFIETVKKRKYDDDDDDD